MVLNNKFSQSIPDSPHPANTTDEWLDLRELNQLIVEAVDQLPAQRKKICR